MAKSHIEDATHELALSVASLWEMAVKISLGKLEAPQPFAAFVQSQLAQSSMTLLDIRPEHALAVADLPFHHRDPFDRLIAVQCLSEGLTLISSDRVFEVYGVDRVW